jgi:hypothetical protein
LATPIDTLRLEGYLMESIIMERKKLERRQETDALSFIAATRTEASIS